MSPTTNTTIARRRGRGDTDLVADLITKKMLGSLGDDDDPTTHLRRLRLRRLGPHLQGGGAGGGSLRLPLESLRLPLESLRLPLGSLRLPLPFRQLRLEGRVPGFQRVVSGPQGMSFGFGIGVLPLRPPPSSIGAVGGVGEAADLLAVGGERRVPLDLLNLVVVLELGHL